MSYAVGVSPLAARRHPRAEDRRCSRTSRRGDGISFALTERHTGSDPSKVATLARRDGDGWRIQGEKWMVGNGGQSRFYTVFARTEGSDRLTAFVLDDP